MPINKPKFHRLMPLLLIVAVSMAVFAAGTDGQTDEPSRVEKPSETTAQASPPEGAPATETLEAAEKTPPAGAATATQIKEFKPTEQIEADSAVSFPIDI